MRYLARFQADPKKVRVSIMRQSSLKCWEVRVTHLQSGRVCWAVDHDPVRALNTALGQAEDAEMEGIDLGLGWTYEHPWGRGIGVAS